MKRHHQIGHGLVMIGVLALAGAAQSARAAEPAVPSGALTADTTFVMWADLSGFNEATVKQALDAIVAAAPEADRERMTQQTAEQLKSLSPIFDASSQLIADGVTSGVLAMSPAAQAGGDPQTQLFLHTQAGESPKAAVGKAARAANAWARQNNPAEAVDDDELDEQLEQAEYVKLDDNWFAVQVEGERNMAPLPEATSAADPAPFVEAMNAEDGAPVRFAFVMSPQMKEQLQQAAADPNAAMMAGLIQPLTELATATGGLWLGDEPKLRISLNFAQEQQAAAFKASSDGMIQFMGQMALAQAMQGNDPNQPPDMEKVQAVMPLLLLEHEGSVISKTLDISILDKLTEAGIPWSAE